MPSKSSFDRREFIKIGTAAAAAAGVLATGAWSQLAAAEPKAVIEKLNIACIGTYNRAAADINGVRGENIVALCDVDKNYLDRTAKKFPSARTYADYREMLESEDDKIDAVVVAAADHHHAPATIRAIRKGKHVYCEKPLTHTVEEARIIAAAAKKAGVATQMGTQIHAGDNYRRVVEMIQAGAIGDVNEVHVWVGKGWGAESGPTGMNTPPSSLNWDLWVGPAKMRPYVRGKYHPAQWRRWWDFGGGTMGDMGCHYMDLPFWALKLRHPTKVEAQGTSGPKAHPVATPMGLTVRYEFPARDKMPPVKFTWYDGRMTPKVVAGERVRGSGVMFVGTKGKMFADYGSYKFFPTEKFADYKPPAQTIAKSIGHHAEWVKACKDGSPTTCNFDYSGALTEAVLLGGVAYRTGKSLDWDGANLKATNAPEADQYIRKEYRKGWEVA